MIRALKWVSPEAVSLQHNRRRIRRRIRKADRAGWTGFVAHRRWRQGAEQMEGQRRGSFNRRLPSGTALCSCVLGPSLERALWLTDMLASMVGTSPQHGLFPGGTTLLSWQEEIAGR